MLHLKTKKPYRRRKAFYAWRVLKDVGTGLGLHVVMSLHVVGFHVRVAHLNLWNFSIFKLSLVNVTFVKNNNNNNKTSKHASKQQKQLNYPTLSGLSKLSSLSGFHFQIIVFSGNVGQ
jgi:hypothetical protein